MMTSVAMIRYQRKGGLPRRKGNINKAQEEVVDTMFLELNQMAMEDQAAKGVEHNNNNNNNNHKNEDGINRVDAELLLYKCQKHLPL
jgi:hypothetical protein